ncbi:hypothetical protein Y032_0004g2013 [Ancylostoma ceylanicum]|uniref:Uncharacterized protein n=1 Tax=Ancylostoma ceylanicum TaxID=53326 RepID=A0A016VUW3_9BILA|nr:hypothetical protein Y032_0004g2013 [Ancylostoma ceylanicum]
MFPHRLASGPLLPPFSPKKALRKVYADILAVMKLIRGIGCMDLVDSEYKLFYAGHDEASSGTGVAITTFRRFSHK